MKRIYGFLNGYDAFRLMFTVVTQDGQSIVSIFAQNEAEAREKLGFAGRLSTANELYEQYYPEGAVLEWVPNSEVHKHAGLQKAITAHREIKKARMEMELLKQGIDPHGLNKTRFH